ncbi:hypothetical protein ACFSWE_08635 [Leucobacter albus]|uniref:Tail assembly chaperone n=1 Tax=Leucobacter albus TaxID=272210 RepID=A0ABW3TSQ5_9MICO
MTETTRSKSAKKPADHKPAAAEQVSIEHGGVKFTAARGSLDSLRTIDMLERGLISTTLRRIIGDKKFEEFLDKNPDAGAEAAGELLEAIAEKVGAKNF